MSLSFTRTVVPIALIFSFRMLGLFMLIPVFSVIAMHLNYATPVLIGIALGAYGLSQGLLQLPFGMLSDKIGRKPIITVGLILFACGSLIGALTDNIYGMIIARTIQGMGAVGSVLIALTADLTSDSLRTKAMAIIGVCIGLSFALAMIISPVLASYSGLKGIFLVTMLLAIIGLALLHWAVPSPEPLPVPLAKTSAKRNWRLIINSPTLMQLNASIFIQHFLLTATFFAVPIILNIPLANGEALQTWYFYLPVMLVAFVCMIPLIILAERKKLMKLVINAAIISGILAQILLAKYNNQFICFTLLITLYFIGFNVLEACLPSLVSKHAPSDQKGFAMGVYSSAQFLGIFFGGISSGFIFQHYNTFGIFLMNAITGVLWLVLIRNLKPLNYSVQLLINLENDAPLTEDCINELRKVPGVLSVSMLENKSCINIKANKEQEESVKARIKMLTNHIQ